ncbi:XRE family transcriptional regulator [Streptomyces abikoensis]|uniref:XRE family transcriptional regulator n=1 Tax=Streptomyces abikoensis TaxID=97398 RepID=A0ABW7TBX0_9ACTN
MTTLGCSMPEIAAEMRVRFALRPREAWRHARGWTLQETADRVNAAGQRSGEGVAADASLVGKWEKWPGPSGRRLTLQALAALAAAFECGLEELLDVDDRRAMTDADRLVLTQLRQSAAAPQSSDEASSAELLGADLIRTAADEAAAWAAWAESTNVGEVALEQLLCDTRDLAREYLVSDPAAVFARTKVLRDRVFVLLEGRQHPRQTRDLYRVAGYLCALLAWMSSDLGHLRNAETHGRTAWLCAQLAENRELAAWVLSTRSKVAFWDGRLRDGITHARRGSEQRPQGTVAILLACQEADAWSELGAGREARAALTRAEEARDAGSSDDIGGLFSCPEIRRANYAAGVRLRVGDPAGALREAEEALRTQPAHAYGTSAQIYIGRAFAHLMLGSPDGAADAVEPVLALASEYRLDPLVHRMRELARALARSKFSGTRPGRQLQMEINAWCTVTAPRLLALSPGQAPE